MTKPVVGLVVPARESGWREAIREKFPSVNSAERRAWRRAVQECLGLVDGSLSRDEAIGKLKNLLDEAGDV